MGAVLAKQQIHDAFMTGPEHLIEFFHGYTYSAHPLACAAGLATLETYADEGLLTRAGELEGYFAEAVHSLKGLPNVIDIRNIGLVGGIELEPIAGEPGKRAFERLPRLLREGRAGAHHRRHRRVVAAADRRARTDRPHRRDARGGDPARRLIAHRRRRH